VPRKLADDGNRCCRVGYRHEKVDIAEKQSREREEWQKHGSEDW